MFVCFLTLFKCIFPRSISSKPSSCFQSSCRGQELAFYLIYLFRFVLKCHWFLLLSVLFPSFCLLWVYFTLFSYLLKKLRLLIWDLLPFLKWVFSAMNFSLITALAMPTDFYMLYILIYFSFISLRLCLWLMDCLELCCLISKCFVLFMLSFCYLFLVWVHYT